MLDPVSKKGAQQTEHKYELSRAESKKRASAAQVPKESIHSKWKLNGLHSWGGGSNRGRSKQNQPNQAKQKQNSGNDVLQAMCR